MHLIHVTFLVFVIYLCHALEPSTTADQNQSSNNTTTTPILNGQNKNCTENTGNIFYKLTKKIFNFLFNQTEKNKQSCDVITTTTTTTPDSQKKEDQRFEVTLRDLPYASNLTDLLSTVGADVCQKTDKAEEIDLLILVDSFAMNADDRRRIRATWYSYWVAKAENVRVLFFLGKPAEPAVTTKLIRENDIHGDMVWSDARNVPVVYGTFKALSWMQWVIKNCSGAKMVLKVKQKVIINVPKLLKFVSDNQKTVNTIWGSVHQSKAPSSHINQHLQSPIKHLLNNAYLMSRDVIKTLFEGSLKKVPFTAHDSIFFTGSVAQRENVTLVDVPEFKGIQIPHGTLSTNQINLSIPFEDCVRYRDHIIFLTSKHKDEWLQLLITFSTCPMNNQL